jgi:dTDP-L-rhamnose 4-epimerase
VKIVVTGAAGFIGSHVVDELVDDGHEVTGIDTLDPDVHPTAPDYLNPAADWVVADVRDLSAMGELCADVDAVCHQAAKVGLGVDLDDIEEYVSNNDLGTATLLRALHRNEFSGRLVVASSMVVYGEGRYLCPVDGEVRPGPRQATDLDAGRFEPPCSSCGSPLTAAAVSEDARIDPRNVYAATKAQQEYLTTTFGAERGLPVTALRYHNVYGPRMPRDTPYAGVASIFRSALERGEAPRVFEDGAQRRDFIHVRDVAHANVLALTSPEPAQGAFNVASGEPHTVGEMAEALAMAFGTGLEPEITGGYRLGDVRHVFASADRAREVLGFNATVPFAAGMSEFASAPLRGADQGG